MVIVISGDDKHKIAFSTVHVCIVLYRIIHTVCTYIRTYIK